MSYYIISYHIILRKAPAVPGGGGRKKEGKEGKKQASKQENHRKFCPLPTVFPILTGGNGNTVPPVRHHPGPSPFPHFCFPTHTEAHCASDSHPAMPLVFPSECSHHVYHCCSSPSLDLRMALKTSKLEHNPSLLPRPKVREPQLRNFHRF